MLATAPPLIRALEMPERSRSPFGAELHAIREEKRLKARVSEAGRYSVRGIASRAELSASAISALESGIDPRTGKATRPRLDTIEMLAGALADDAEDREEIYLRLVQAAGYVPDRLMRPRDDTPPSGAPTTIEVIVRLNPGSEGLSDEDKAFLERLAERSKFIIRGEPDPGP